MEFVRDPKRVKRLANRCEDENWDFRVFLKNARLGSRNIDKIAHRLHEEVANQINCLECGNCCRKLSPLVTLEDVSKLSSRMGKDNEEVIDRYLQPKDEKGNFALPAPCPLLSGNECTVYGSHPAACHSYPHLHKKDFVTRLMGVVNNCSICPIAFNVYEGLKAELWERWKEWEKTDGAWLLR